MRSVVVICWSIHIFVRRGQKEQLWKCCLSVWDTTWGARSTHFCICYCNTFCCNLILVIKKDAKTNNCCTFWKVKILPASACGEQYYNAARFSFNLSHIWMTGDNWIFRHLIFFPFPCFNFSDLLLPRLEVGLNRVVNNEFGLSVERNMLNARWASFRMPKIWIKFTHCTKSKVNQKI